MRVFVTGATGFIGSAVVRELLDAGHRVLGLARSEEAVASLAAAGAEAHRGSLTDPESLRAGAAAADGVIHTAFNHDFSDFAGAMALDRRAVEALGDALAGSGRPLVVTSGTALVASSARGAEVTEADASAAPDSPAAARFASERAALASAARGVRVSLVRLPPSVHGRGDHGFVPTLIGIARDRGVSAYVGEGANRWSAVHRLDAARLFRLALESAPAGTRWHGVAERGVPFREIAGVIGRRLEVPVVSVPQEAAADAFGWFGAFAAVDNPAASAVTRTRLGWGPTRPGLIADLDDGHYFVA